jgi:hypothetical protein
MSQKFFYGGQAVIEGVMIRGKKAAVTAVRRPNGETITRVIPLTGIYTGWMRRAPFLRGIIVLIESMVLGIKSLMYSASVSLEEEIKEEISAKAIWGTIIFSFALAIVLFLLVPLFLTKLLDQYIDSALMFNLVEGLIRLAIFLGYLVAVGMVPDIKRVFRYHGAEHKAVNAYEAGVPMEVEAIKKYGTAHVRCGTSFLFVVLVIAIIVFSFIGRPGLWVMILSRLLLIPVIAALSYEVVHFGARHAHNPLVRAILAPGRWLQGLTAKEPADTQLEVAIVALKKAVEIDSAEAAQSS